MVKHLKRFNKKIICLVVLLSLIATGVFIAPTKPAQAALTPEFCFGFNSGTKTITSYQSYAAWPSPQPGCPIEVEIPATIDGVPVEVIGGDAFFRSGVTSVIIPNSVTTIAPYAFYYSDIQSVTFGNSVQIIGEAAFMGNSLTSITLPSSVTTIDVEAFSNNAYLTSVTIPSSVTSIDASAFSYNGDYLGRYVRITLENIANPYGLQDNHDYGIINTASVTLQFKNSAGDNIAPNQVITGDGLSDYLYASNLTDNFSLYYRIGDTKTFTAPEVEGYITPVDKTVTLTGADNTVTFVYGSVHDDGGEDEATNQTMLVTATTSKSVSLQTPEDTTITCSNALEESTQTKRDGLYDYPLGLVEFCFDTEQTDNTVSLVFVTDLKPSEVIARKYNSTTQTYFDISDATIAETQYQGQHALRLSYDIADNGMLDLDPALGSIKDPVGFATREKNEGLAQTGSSVTYLWFAASLLVGSSMVFWVAYQYKNGTQLFLR